jgi:hypothetical protein
VKYPRRIGICASVVALALAGSSFAALATASAAFVQQRSGGIGIRLVPDATNASAEPLALSYVVEQMAPGSRFTRQIEISNTTDATANVAVFPAGANMARGEFSFAPGRTGDPLSNWTTVAHPALSLAPGATVFDEVTTKLPKNASSGERYAVIWAEVSASSPMQGGVRLINRVGVRMYVSVGKGGSPVAEFTIGTLEASRMANGNPLVAAKVRNVGQAALDITGELTLSHGPGGLSAGPFPFTLAALLAPSHSTIAPVELGSQIPRGPWRADLTLSSGGTQRSSVSTITFPAENLSSGQHSIFARPMLVVLSAFLLLLLLLLVAGGSVLLFRRHRLRHG